MSKITLTAGQLRLLQSYADGPRIWDAASVMNTVYELRDLRLITPSPDMRTDELTELGRQTLDQMEGPRP
jgi:hypothetical protein